ncbi:MAG: hypothetical protein AAGA21_01950 [Pseudomonadota bacterium]
MHQFRIHSIFALIGLGSLIEIVSRYTGGSNVAPLMIMVSSILMLLLNSYYRRRETAWEMTSFQIQEHAAYIAKYGYEEFSMQFGEIIHPDRVYYRNYRRRKGLFKLDLMTILTFVAFVLINSTVGLKLASETYKISIERRDAQTAIETNIPMPMKRPQQ